MSAPANRWKLGLFVLAASAVVATGSAWLGVHNLERASHPAMAYFDEALTGLEEGSPVKFRGVSIGVVRRIRVGPDKKHLAVEAALYDDYLVDLGFDPVNLDDLSPLPENLRAMVVMSWVTGTAFIQVDFFPDPPKGPQLLPFPAPPNTMRTVPSTAKSLEDASRELLRELPAMASATREFVQLLNTELQAVQAPELSRRAQKLLETIEQKVAEFDVRGTVNSADATLLAARELIGELRTVLGGASLVETAATARAALDRLGAASDRLGAASSDVAQQTGDLTREVREQLGQLRATLTAIEKLAELLERDPGALLRGRGAPPRSPIEERR